MAPMLGSRIAELSLWYRIEIQIQLRPLESLIQAYMIYFLRIASKTKCFFKLKLNSLEMLIELKFLRMRELIK